MKQFLNSLAFFVIFVVGFQLVQSSITNIYYDVFNGNYFLNVKSLEIGGDQEFTTEEKIPFIFCREPKVRIVARENIRNYFRDIDGRSVSVKERTLPDGISYERQGDACTELNLFPDNTPEAPGTYIFCQEFTFDIGDKVKTADFCSNEFKIIEEEKI